MKYVRSFDRDLFAGSVLKCTAGDMGLIPVLETEFHMLCGASTKKKKKKEKKKEKENVLPKGTKHNINTMNFRDRS